MEAGAQDVKTRAEAEGKMMFYASFNATHSKVLTDGFKQLYPKIDATFYRATDAQMMERILTEARARAQSLGRDDDLELLRLQLEETRYCSLPMIRRNENSTATATRTLRRPGLRSTPTTRPLASTPARWRKRIFPNLMPIS